MNVIRTQKHLTITEAHPYHHYLQDDRASGGHALVALGYDARCPLCRENPRPAAEHEAAEFQG